jgi:hypothetical protein
MRRFLPLALGIGISLAGCRLSGRSVVRAPSAQMRRLSHY